MLEPPPAPAAIVFGSNLRAEVLGGLRCDSGAAEQAWVLLFLSAIPGGVLVGCSCSTCDRPGVLQRRCKVMRTRCGGVASFGIAAAERHSATGAPFQP